MRVSTTIIYMTLIKCTEQSIYVIGFIIRGRMTIVDLLKSQIGTQPLLIASSAGYPLIKAAEVVAKNMNRNNLAYA